VTIGGPGRSRHAEIGGLRLHQARIHIEGAAGGAAITEDYEPVIVRSVASAGLIADLLATAQSGGSWESLGPDRYAAARRRIDDWGQRHRHCGSGAPGSGSRDPRALSPPVNPPSVWRARPGSGSRRVFATPAPERGPERTRAFIDWVAAAERSRVACFDVLRRGGSAAKSTGAASVLDAAPLLASLRARTPARAIAGPHAGPADLVVAQEGLEAAQARAARDEWASAQQVTRRIMARLGDDDRWPALGDAVQHTLDLAHDNHLLPRADDRDRAAALRAAVPDDAIDLARRVAGRAAPSSLRTCGTSWSRPWRRSRRSSGI
jgi:hypothetical protein